MRLSAISRFGITTRSVALLVSVASLVLFINTAASAMRAAQGNLPSCVPAPVGLSYWFPAEGSGANAVGGPGGHLSGGVGFAPGMVGQAFSFNGIDGAVETDPTTGMNSLPLTLEAWVRPSLRSDGEAGTNTIFGPNFFPPNVIANDRPGVGGLGFGFNISTEGPSFVIERPGGFRKVETVAIQPDEWYHVVVVYEPEGLIAYVNGTQVDEFAYASVPLNGVNFIRIGKHNDDTSYSTRRFFKGLIDEASIFEAALSADEVRSLFEAGSAGKCPGQLVARLTFAAPEDGSGNPPRDLTASVVPVASGTAESLGRTGELTPRDSVIAYNVYRSGTPNVQTTQANFYTSVPPAQTSTTAPLAAGGSFFVVTAVYGNGESGPSNEVGAGQPGADVTQLKIKPTGVTATGTGFSDTVQVFVDGLPFTTAAKVKKGRTKVNQKGTLITGQPLGTYKPKGAQIEVTFLNSDGRLTRKVGVIP